MKYSSLNNIAVFTCTQTYINTVSLPQQWHGRSGQASLPHLKLKDLQMSDSRELSNITTTSSMYQLLHHFVFLFFFLWRISKIPKTATVTSPICQALRSARSLRHFSFFFPYQWTFHFFAEAVSFKLMPTYWKWRPKKRKMSSHFVLNFLKMLSLLSTPLLCVCHGLPSLGRWNALSILKA